VEYQLIEEYYNDIVEERGIDSGDEVLQVLTISFEPELGESREDNACERRRTSAGQCSVSLRARWSESKVK